MKFKSVTAHDGGHYGIRFQCPGCEEAHVLPTKPHERGWDFNGDFARPTLAPSILVYSHKEYREIDGKMQVVDTPRCHSFVREGRIEFLSDSTHALAGKTVDLPELPE